MLMVVRISFRSDGMKARTCLAIGSVVILASPPRRRFPRRTVIGAGFLRNVTRRQLDAPGE